VREVRIGAVAGAFLKAPALRVGGEDGLGLPGDATESDFAALASTKSTDSGTASNGGLVSNMRKGAYVQPFEDWSFDPSRQSGDTGIIEPNTASM